MRFYRLPFLFGLTCIALIFGCMTQTDSLPAQNGSEKKDEPKEPPPPSRQSQDDRILDQLENAPTVDPDTAKQRARARKVRGTADK